VLKDSCFYSSLPAEAVTIAILKYVSFQLMLSNEQKTWIFETVFLFSTETLGNSVWC